MLFCRDLIGHRASMHRASVRNQMVYASPIAFFISVVSRSLRRSNVIEPPVSLTMPIALAHLVSSLAASAKSCPFGVSLVMIAIGLGDLLLEAF